MRDDRGKGGRLYGRTSLQRQARGQSINHDNLTRYDLPYDRYLDYTGRAGHFKDGHSRHAGRREDGSYTLVSGSGKAIVRCVATAV